ncbi:copper homeostasis protein CutC [Photobacterium gaetbulicola]|uniref:PF03932 family protein CutC n=1 Tax=Photobacterium gaetbulicola TaxID=1295392 RepID=A0A0B9GJQ1_9GAMM|nr:copper homeostasis protein CutC [Photobacterium gaetbulicola]KHT59171.1 copper homeostasis protein CutC [Photobacterium gaetbulicola]
MTIDHIEVCIDNIESLHLAQQGGATRIELCASLALGGLTPNAGLMQLAAKHAKVPVYAMIRARQGDFLFSSQDKEIMLADAHMAKQAGLNGLVIGALNDDSTVDTDFLADISRLAGGMGLTFHRAIDQCLEPMAALDTIMQHNCERVLTSGLEANAFAGIPMLKQMVAHCGEHLAIMAGAGVNANNVTQIVQQTGIREVHLSGKSTRPSLMRGYASSAHMGNADLDDFTIPVTDPGKIAALVKALSSL